MHATRCFLLLAPPKAVIASLLTSLFFTPPLRAADPPTGQMVGGIEAFLYICTAIDAKSAKIGSDLLTTLSAKQKLDLPAIRKTGDYQSIYNSEVNRFLLLGARQRLAACQNAW